MKTVYTVKQVNEYIKNMLEQDFLLNRLYVKGEVSNCTYHGSGHIYFSLKDESGTISCVMFAGQRSGLAFKMKVGDQVVVLGRVSAYPRSGSYQVYANEIIPDGGGLLHERFEALKRELSEMGMFEEEYKKAIPTYVQTIGVVTAPTGAAVQDIINIVQRRNPYVQIVLYPAIVQGEQAAQSIVDGIRALEKSVKPDVMIVGRGGGSMEDLWAFNEEIVARAIFESSIPIISAVGHETDTTIADYVADMRAPTPSAAAELATFEYQTFYANLEEKKNKMYQVICQHITMQKQKSEQKSMQLKYLHPQNRLREQQHRLLEIEEKLQNYMQGIMERKRHRLEVLITQLKGLSPLDKISKGYGYVQTEDGSGLLDITKIKADDAIKITMSSGVVDAKVMKVEIGEIK